jgi:hypothetical protein
MQQFKDLEVNVSVLTTGYWPAYTPLDLKLPPQLAQCQDVFRGFYLAKYQGRRLFWQHTLGHTVLKSFFPKVLTRRNRYLQFWALLVSSLSHISFSLSL